LKLIELLVRLQKRVLHYVFGIFAVLRNVLRNPEDLPLVFVNEFVVRRDISAADPLNQGHIGMLLVFACYRLDGRHGGWLREICGPAQTGPNPYV
jgi:hypothetical protein